MPFSNEDNALIKNLYQFKGYGLWRILTEFSKINCKKGRTGHFAEKDLRNRKHRPKARQTENAHTEDNLTVVDEQVIGLLSQEDQTQTLRSTHQMYRDMCLTQSSVIQVIHGDLDLKCIFRLPTRLLAIIVSLSYIHISQGSVATLLMCGGIFNNHFIANCPQSKRILKIGQYLAKICRMTQWYFFETQCIYYILLLSGLPAGFCFYL